MKKIILINLLLTFLVVIVTHYTWKTSPSSAPVIVKQETALERVKRTGTLRCGYYSWPPLFVIDPNTKKISGFYKDASDAVFNLTGWKIQYVEVIVGNEVEDLRLKRIDVMCGSGPWYLGSIKEASYTTPLAYVPIYVYGRIDENRFKTTGDFNSSKIRFAGIDGDLSVDLVHRFYPDATLKPLPQITDVAQLLLNVTTKKADIAIVDPVSVTNYNKNNADKLKPLFPEKPLVVYGLGFSVLKGEADMLDTLNQFSTMAINMGLMDKVIHDYDPDKVMFMPVAQTYKDK